MRGHVREDVGDGVGLVLKAVNDHAVAARSAGAGVNKEVAEEHRVPVAAAEGPDVVEGADGVEGVVTVLITPDALDRERRLGVAIPLHAGDPRTGLGRADVTDAHLAEMRDAVGAAEFDRSSEGRDAHDLGQEEVAHLRGAVGIPTHVALMPPIMGVVEVEVAREAPDGVQGIGDVIDPQHEVGAVSRAGSLAAHDDPAIQVVDRRGATDRLGAIGERMTEQRAGRLGARLVKKTGCGDLGVHPACAGHNEAETWQQASGKRGEMQRQPKDARGKHTSRW